MKREHSFGSRLMRGFTLVELMIVVVLVAVLMTIATPYFGQFILNQRLITTSADLRIALSTARSEAVKRNRAVGLNMSDDGWSAGWSIPNPEAVDLPDVLNHVQTGDITITKETGPASEVVFSPQGRALAAANFEIVVGPDPSKATGCLRLRIDGRMEYCRQSCPFADPKPDSCGS